VRYKEFERRWRWPYVDAMSDMHGAPDKFFPVLSWDSRFPGRDPRKYLPTKPKSLSLHQ